MVALRCTLSLFHSLCSTHGFHTKRKLVPQFALKWSCNSMLHGNVSSEILMGERMALGRADGILHINI